MKLLRVLGAVLSILSLHAHAAPRSVGSVSSVHELEESSATEVLRKFVKHLESFRRGSDSDAETLLDLGRRACDQFDRCDVLEVAQFYTSLSADQRTAGLRHEEEFRGCWRRVREAHSAHLDEASWLSAREAILTELEDLAQRASALADPSPAARAGAFRAASESRNFSPATSPPLRNTICSSSVANERNAPRRSSSAEGTSPRASNPSGSSPGWTSSRASRSPRAKVSPVCCSSAARSAAWTFNCTPSPASPTSLANAETPTPSTSA